jgi:hypothetical protein
MALINLLKSLRYRALSAIDGRHCSSFISPQDAIKHKKNDTLFIFGSGCSSLDGVELISNKIDTMTINYSMFLPIKPNFILFELPKFYDKVLYSKIMEHKKEGYSSLLYRPSKRDRKLSYKYELLFDSAINEVRIPYKDTKYLKNIIKKSIAGKYKKFYYYRISIISALFFAATLGYKKVYLWGVDLNKSKTFYQYKPNDFNELFDSIKYRDELNNAHITERPLKPGDGAIEHIKLLSELFSEFGVTVHCVTKKSALYGLGQDL